MKCPCSCHSTAAYLFVRFFFSVAEPPFIRLACISMGIIIFKRSIDSRKSPLRGANGGPLMCGCFIATSTTCCNLFTSGRVPFCVLRMCVVCDSFAIRIELSSSSLMRPHSYQIIPQISKRKIPRNGSRRIVYAFACTCSPNAQRCFASPETKYTIHRITMCACASHFDFMYLQVS